MSCCGGNSKTKPSQVLKAAQEKVANPPALPIPAHLKPEDFKISPEVKADLLRQQQIARIKKA